MHSADPHLLVSIVDNLSAAKVRGFRSAFVFVYLHLWLFKSVRLDQVIILDPLLDEGALHLFECLSEGDSLLSFLFSLPTLEICLA